MKKIFLLLSLGWTFSHAYEFIDITKYGREQYQPIIINNKMIKEPTHNHMDYQNRYEHIQSVLNNFNRPFTLLDLGASQGYYSFRAAHDYDCVCVMIEGNNPSYPMTGTQLRELCELNTDLNNVILLQKPLNIPDMRRLSECEHFDVVLVFNIIHWLGPEWRKAVDAILNMGDYIIIETPPQESIKPLEDNRQRQAIMDYLGDKGATMMGKVQRHTSNAYSNIYLIERKKEYLERRTWLMPTMKGKTHTLISSYDEKKLYKKCDAPANHYMTSEWLPGINLITFKMYDGSWPTAKMLISDMEHMSKQPKYKRHNDWMPNNFIVQGNKLEMIDFDDPSHNPGAIGGCRRASERFLKHVYEFLREKTAKKAERLFWDLRGV